MWGGQWGGPWGHDELLTLGAGVGPRSEQLSQCPGPITQAQKAHERALLDTPVQRWPKAQRIIG